MYVQMTIEMYRSGVPDVGVAQLRRELKDWLDRVRAGDDVIITERGRPIARLTGIDTTPILDRLVADGVISPAPPSPRPKLSAATLVKTTDGGNVSEYVVAEREAKR